MVIDALPEPAPARKSTSEKIESLRDSKMNDSRDLELPNSSSTSSHKPAGEPQRVGTYIIERTIGKGNFSFVKLAHHTVTNVKVAIKIIDKTKLNEENLKKAQREADILKSLHHPNIIKLYQVMESEKLLCIVTEYLPNGELYEYIARNGYLNEQVARHKFMEILSAVEHCHLNSVVHRDLKAENMLLDHHMSIKLADFGFGTFQPNGPDSLLTTWCGSPPYAAPEIFKGEPYLGVSADIWSLGVILYVLVCGVLPFNAQEVSCLRRQVLEEHVRVPYWLSVSCEDLLKRMLAKSPSKRPSIAEIYNSRWLSEINDLGPIPFPLALDEQDSSMGVRLSTSLDAGTSASATTAPSLVPHWSHSSFQSPPSPTLAAEMKAGKLDETVIQIMENSGIDRGQLLESLKRCAYDHLTATYLLLGETLRKNRHSLSQTLVPQTEEVDVLYQTRKRLSQQQQQIYLHQQPHARSSCPSGDVAVELLFQQHLPTWHQRHNQNYNKSSTYFAFKKEPSSSFGAAVAPSFVRKNANPDINPFICSGDVGGHGIGGKDAPIYPSSHPRQSFLFGPTLPLVAEFSGPGSGGVGGALRRTDASPPPLESPINLSSRSTAESTMGVGIGSVGGGCGGDCFEPDWFPYQSEGVASSPAPVFSFGGEFAPKQSSQSVFGGPSYPFKPLSTANAVFLSSTNPSNASNLFNAHQAVPLSATNSHEVDLNFAPPQSTAMTSTSVVTHPHSHSHNQPPIYSTNSRHKHQRRYSATGTSSRLLPLPASLLQCACDSQHLYEKCVNDEHTSGLGSSIEADSRHSSFSHPTAAASIASALAHASHFTPMETGGLNEEVGIDIPTTARVPRKRISSHSPLVHPASCSATSPAAALAAAAALAMGGCPRRKFGVIERPPALMDQLSRFQFHQIMGHQQQQASSSHATQQQPFNSMDF